jgi:hypothetical protein
MAAEPSAASTMISGPDLGGGFLHQLSVEGVAESSTFTFHAQDGGSDAGGPPKGPLDALGFIHPSSACMFGGPRCWHRRFRLPRAAAATVRAAYNRTRFTMEAMISQAHAGAPVEIRAALVEVVDRLHGPLAEAGVEWYIGGSTAAWLQGAEVLPRDIDLGTSRAGVGRVGELLRPYLIEPVAPTDWPSRGAVDAARAFVGTLNAGARVEWSVPTGPARPLPLEEFGATAGVVRLLPVPFEGRTILTSRPEYGLVRAAVVGRPDREPMWTALVRRLGPDLELLDVLLTRSHLPPARQSSVRDAVRSG